MWTVAKLALLLLPEVAYAQYVPIGLAAAALSPLLVLLLAVVLGFVTRSWGVGARDTSLVLLWVFLSVVCIRIPSTGFSMERRLYAVLRYWISSPRSSSILMNMEDLARACALRR